MKTNLIAAHASEPESLEVKLEVLERAEKRIDELLKKNAADIASMQVRLAEAQAQAVEAKARAEAAVARGDETAFANGLTATREAEAQRKFLQERIAWLQSSPLMTETEFRETIAAIRAEADGGMKTLDAEVRGIFTRLVAIRNEANALTQRADEAIYTMQKRLAKVSNGPTARTYTNPRVETREGFTASLPRDLVGHLNAVLTFAGIEEPPHLI